MSSINRIELIEHFATGGSNRICDTDELCPITNMNLQVIQQLLWHV